MKFTRSSAFGLLLSLTIAVVSAALALFAVVTIAASRLDKVRQAEVHTQNLAQALNANISNEVHQIDMALVTVASEMEKSLASGRLDLPRMNRFIATLEKLHPEAVAIRVTDADGKVILNNPSVDSSAHFRDRPFWIPLRDHPEAGLFITKPILGVFTKKWVITHARRYNLPDGRFGGVVIAPVFVDHFQKRLADFNVGTGGRITLRDRESGFVAGIPTVVKGKTLSIGDKEVSHELQSIVASGVQLKTYGAVTPFDQTKRILTFRRIEGVPMYVVASLAEEDVLAQWRVDRRNVYIALGVSISVFTILAGFLWRFWRGRERDAEALFASRKEYQNLVENTPDLVTRFDLEGRMVFVNHASLPIYGLTPEACVGRRAFDFIAAEDLERTKSAFESWLKRDEDVFAFENRQVGVDGQVHCMAWLISAERDEHGKVVGFASTARDITDRKQAEVALRESEERWKFAIEGAGDGLWDWNVQTGEAYYSPRYKEMLGYSDADIGTTSDEWSKRIHPDDAPGVFTVLQPYMEGKPGSATIEFRMLSKDGSWRWMKGRGLVVSRDANGRPMRMIGTNSDITVRKQAELALKQSEQDYRHLFEMANDAILIFEPETELILEANQASCRIYGFDRDELVGMDLKTLTKDVPRGASQIEKLMASGLYHNFETTQLNKQGEEIHFLINSSVITYRGRRAILSLNRDIGERKRLEAQVHHAQKMESLGTLAGGVAHDMNNVLGAILGLASAHIGNQPFGSPLHQALDTICKATERGGKMVKSLLGFARQSPAETTRIDMNAILREQVALLERTTLATVRLEIDLEADLRPILGDSGALTHAFMNLCVNAVDAMPENGTLTLRTRNVDNDWIEVVVEDNGKGMPKAVLEKAMEPFFTTKETGKGTGLGLSMVFSTVKAHRGQMAIESEPGQGTRVMLRFPACEQESSNQADVPAVSETRLPLQRSLKVLLVDDDDLIQGSVQALLEVLGHPAVTTALSGEAALAKLEAGLEADLVILDMNMPGLGGIGTLPRLRGLRPEVPVLLATGRVDQTALSLASAHAGVTLLSKPFGLRELQKYLESIGLG